MVDALNEKWNDWDQPESIKTKDSYIKRVSGELPEKEASKSAAEFLKNKRLYKAGDRLLDIGGSCGHFLRSFKNRLDPDIDYTCIDASPDFITEGRRLWESHARCEFVHGDCLKMPFENDRFDIAYVNLFHFFPDVKAALEEALRVTKGVVVWRTPVSQKENYNIRYTFDRPYTDLNSLDFDSGIDYCIVNIFTRKYLSGMVSDLGASLEIFERDDNFGDFDNTELPEFSDQSSTKTVAGMQINGCLILDWHYVVIRKG